MKKRMLSIMLAMVLTVPYMPAAGAYAGVKTLPFRLIENETAQVEVPEKESSNDALEYLPEELVQVMVELREMAGTERDAALAVQKELLSEIAAIAGVQDLEADFHYTRVVNGFSVKVPYCVLDKIAALDDVLDVHVAARYQSPETDDDDMEIWEEEYPTANGMIGGDEALSQGYDGTGMLVAVIDTGIDVDHPAFAGQLDESRLALTEQALSQVLDKLNASAQYEGLSVDDVYYSGKIPFGFNYIDNSTDITHDNDNSGHHGTHVAGILAACGEKSEIVGVVPGAQLLIMKVFGQSEEDASEAALVAAIEDAVLLDADVINMSLGATVGFSREGTTLAKAIQNAMDQGVAVCAAAGNEVSSTYGNLTGMDLGLAENVDIGAVCSPAAQEGVLAAASVEYGISYAHGFCVTNGEGNEEIVTFSDTGAQFGVNSFTDLLGISGYEDGVFEYVCVPGLGAEKDYAEVDAVGKVAVVRRGELTFAEKSENAFRSGAIAMIVCNNVSESVSMDLTGVSQENKIPCVIVEMAEGELLAELAGEDGVGLLMLSGELHPVRSEYDGQLSYFSSWGGGSDLTLKPEIAGVGGSVYSAVNDGSYGVMSGTSMATPQVSGGMAVLLQYLKETRGITGSRGVQLAKTLLMNTADPAVQSDGVEYSPRKQGAGLVDLGGALHTDVYAMVDGSGLPKAELGDDSGRSGRYCFYLSLYNMSDGDRSFVTSASILTECEQDGYMLQQARKADADVTIINLSTAREYLFDLSGNGVLDSADPEKLRELLKVGSAEADLEHFDLDENGVTDEKDAALFEQALDGQCEKPDGLERMVVTVPARGMARLYVSISLSEEEKKHLQETFENGVYIEGYITLDGRFGEETLSVPILVFYGDWSKAPLFETSGLAEQEALAWDGSSGNCPIPFAVYTGEESWLGMNPVGSEGEYRPDRSNALNMTGGEGGTISEIYFDLLRNARRIMVEVVSSSGAVLYRSTGEDIPKSCYSDQYGEMLPAVWSMLDETFSFDPNDYGLKAGDCAVLRITGQKDCSGAYQTEKIEIPVYFDGGEPELLSVQVERGHDLSKKCEVTLTMKDDFYVAGVMLLTADGESVVDAWVVDQQKKGENVSLTLDVAEYIQEIGGQLVVSVMDYAHNASQYEISVLEDGETSILPEAAMLAYNSNYYEDGWTFFDMAGKGIITSGFRNYLGPVCAAEAAGDTLFVVLDDAVDTLYAIDCATFLPTETFDLGLEPYMDEVLDMTWCHQDDLMYVLVRGTNDSRVLCVDVHEETAETLCTIGDSQNSGAGVYALACGGDGTLYLIAGEREKRGEKEIGVLYAVNSEDGSTRRIGSLGIEMENSVVSATVDKNSDVLYFTHYFCRYDLGEGSVLEEGSALYACDLSASRKQTEEIRDLGASCYEALLLTGDRTTYFPSDGSASALRLSHETERMLQGNSFCLAVEEYRPWYVTGEGYSLSYTSSDASIVRVDDDGVVTAVGPGEAVVTVTAARHGDVSLAAHCHVTVEEDTFFSALRNGRWIKISLNTMRDAGSANQMISDASAAAYGAGSGPDGQDVVYVIDRGQRAEKSGMLSYTLYTYDAESGKLLESGTLSNRWEFLGEAFPEGGFADMAFDPVRSLLLAVSGRRCFAIDPALGAVQRVYTVDECPDDRELVGIAVDDDGTGWFVDSESVLYRLDGYYIGSVMSTAIAELRLAPVLGGASLEYDQIRGVLWLRWGWNMFSVDLTAEGIRAIRRGGVPGDLSCLFIPGY